MLVTTKFIPPGLSARSVSRDRLLSRLREATEQARVVLLCAPAGFGKTTACVQWLRAQPIPCAWISFDASDDDREHFLDCLLEGFARVLPETTRSIRAMLQGPGLPAPEAAIAALINVLSSEPSPVILALDDVHLLRSPGVLADLSFLLERLPASVQVILMSRLDPPIPLSRLRVRSLLAVIGPEDLRFDAGECRAFLGGTMELELEDTLIQALITRTEGWPAGLQLAALSLRAAPEPEIAVRSFGASDRYLVDYLSDEILSGLDPATIDFLERCSLLDRFHGPLCRAITGREDSSLLLQRLERDRLFLVPLDRAAGWYRLHHLFQAVLRQRLELRAEAEIPALHRLAAQAFERESSPSEALRHWFAAGEHEIAADRLDRWAFEMLSAFDLASLRTLASAVPPEVLVRRPRLLLTLAWCRVLGGRPVEAETLIAMVPGGWESLEDSLRGHVLAMRSLLVVLGGRPDESLELARAAQALLSEKDAFAARVVEWSRAFGARQSGRLAQALEGFASVRENALRMGNPIYALIGATEHAHVLDAMGRLCDARRSCEETLSWARELGLSEHTWTRYLEPTYAWVLYQQGRVDEALERVREGLEKVRRMPEPNLSVLFLSAAARILRAQGMATESRACVQELQACLRSGALVPSVRAWALHAIALDHIALGETLKADTLASFEGLPAIDIETLGQQAIVRAQVLLARGCADQAIELALPATARARAQGWGSHEVQLLVLLSLAHRARSDPEKALETLEDALRFAGPEGYVRVFLDGGPPMVELLDGLSRGSSVGASRARLLLQTLPESERPSWAASTLKEPLSAREQEILALLAQGLENRQIAKRLFISPGTVKAHTAAIYRKLGVCNRTGAVARGRDLHLL